VPGPRPQAWTGTPAARGAALSDARVNPAWIYGSIACAVLACLYLAFVPTVNELPGELVLNDDGVLIRKFDQETHLQAHVWAIVVLPLSIGLAAAPLFMGATTKKAVICGAGLGAIAILTGLWLGLGALLLAFAAVLLIVSAAVIELKPIRENMEARLQGL
jgi:hypothetical protein